MWAQSQADGSHAHPISQTERNSHHVMVQIYETAKRELSYNATRFL